MDIEEMLIEAEHGKRGNLVESRITEIANPNIIHIGKKYLVELAAIAAGINAVTDKNRD